MQTFIDRILPVPKNGGFSMEDYWVWCGSAIRAEDGRYHLFASRWPRYTTFPGWLTHSEIVRAVSDTPEGPYQFAEVVFPKRGSGFWDGMMTHNPTIHRCGGQYLLFYTGTTYSFPVPGPGNIMSRDKWQTVRAQQAIGLATAPSVEGPWQRRETPILGPQLGKWDAFMTTNPAACIHADGSVLLVYKSTAHHEDLLHLGVARAEIPEGPYKRLSDEPLFTRHHSTHGDLHIEDPYIWRSGDRYEMIAKDLNGNVCGESGAGFHASSADGATWHISDPPKAYSLVVRWDDGTTTEVKRLERPQLLIEYDRPTHLFCAIGVGEKVVDDASRHWNMARSWNAAIPLRA